MSRTATQTNMEDTAVNPTTAPRSRTSDPPGDSAVPVAEASPSENLESTTGSSTPAHDSEDHPSNGDQGPSTAPEEEDDLSGISTDRFKTVNQTTKPVLYQLEWRDKRNRTKPSFYSSEPFTNLNVVEDTVSAQYQSKDVQKKHIAIEIITRIRGTAARDEKDDSGPVYIDRPGQRPRPYPEPPLPLGPQMGSPPPAFPGPGPFSPLPTYDIYGEVPREEQSSPPAPPAPYKLEEVAIKHIGQTRVIVHSLHLMKVLRSIVNYYPMQNLHKSKTTISEPFSVLIHHYAELKAFSITGPGLSKDEDQDQEEGHDKQDQVEKMIEHTKILLDFLEPHYYKFFETVEDRLSRDIPLARYEELWYLFRPGTDVYFKMYSKQMAGVVVGCKYADTDYIETLEVRVWYLLFDGKVARRKARSLIIYKYQGEEEVTELTVCPSKPWDFKDGGKRRKAFETRGQEVFQLCKNRFKQVYYNGKLTAEEDPATFKGLVIIDNDPINDYTADHPDDGSTSSRSRSRSRGRSVSTAPSSQYLDDSDGSSISSRLTDSDTDLPPPPPPPGDVVVQPASTVKMKKRDDSMWSKYKNVTVDSPNLTGHHYFLVMPFIEGFAVLQKKWRTFDIDCMSEVPRREEILDNVVMESTKQAIIRAISHPQSHAWKLDFIQGKGEGQIVLLHGPPGVGKTYTVECAAEATGRPLIFLTIADIGLDERRIEEQMTKWFSLAERWEAILLIDEADIFLERRRGADIARNGLVSVFLRKMEYFRGLLFLTTNRIGQIDDAFLSRIHVVIGYTPLDETKRKRIWNGFFQKLERDMKSPKTTGPKVVVSKYAKQYVLNDEEVKNLQWNGREIRNAFQTAISLAGYEAAKDPDWTEEKGVDVEKEHFESVVAMSREFHDYMDSITQQPESERARSRFERNDAHLGVGGSGSG